MSSCYKWEERVEIFVTMCDEEGRVFEKSCRHKTLTITSIILWTAG